MRASEEFYYNDGYTYITASHIRFNNGQTIPLSSINHLDTSAPIQEIDWRDARRRTFKRSIGRMIGAILLFYIGYFGASVIGLIVDIDRMDFIPPLIVYGLGIPAVLLFVFSLAGFVGAIRTPSRTQVRNYYIIIGIRGEAESYRHWWEDRDVRDRIYNSIQNARSYRA